MFLFKSGLNVGVVEDIVGGGSVFYHKMVEQNEVTYYYPIFSLASTPAFGNVREYILHYSKRKSEVCST